MELFAAETQVANDTAPDTRGGSWRGSCASMFTRMGVVVFSLRVLLTAIVSNTTFPTARSSEMANLAVGRPIVGGKGLGEKVQTLQEGRVQGTPLSRGWL